jgi:hypothetical protein
MQRAAAEVRPRALAASALQRPLLYVVVVLTQACSRGSSGQCAACHGHFRNEHALPSQHPLSAAHQCTAPLSRGTCATALSWGMHSCAPVCEL